VKPHVSSTLAKLWLGLRDRTQVVVFAYEGGLVAAGEHDIGH
jgi:DNA-binding NarL/FixJ family response regulator